MHPSPGERLPTGDVRRWRVCAHHLWGIHVESIEAPIHVGVIDRLYVSDQVVESEEWPHPGEIIDAVVQGYMPNGQLRLSTRGGDLAQATETRG